jgi:hypothetical protein
LLLLFRVVQLEAELASATAARQAAEANAGRVAAALQQQTAEAAAAAAAAEQAAAAAAAALAQEKQGAAAAAAKARGDQMVLAKEVQRLRGELNHAKQVRWSRLDGCCWLGCASRIWYLGTLLHR